MVDEIYLQFNIINTQNITHNGITPLPPLPPGSDIH